MGSLYGYEVDCDGLPLRRLNGAPGARGTITVAASASPLPAPDAEPVSVLENERGNRYYASYEIEGDCLLVMPPSGSFLIEPGLSRVTVDAERPDDELFEHRLASSAICTLLAMRGDLTLHASAARVDGRAVVFCGPSERGKTTIARALGEAGHEVIAEDGVDISLDGEPTAFPGARGVRVRPDPGDRRAELAPDPGPGEPGPCPVAAVVLLDERQGALGLERMEAARALALLTPNLIHSGGREAVAGAFSRLAHLLHTVPALRAELPDDLAGLPRAAEELLDAGGVRG